MQTTQIPLLYRHECFTGKYTPRKIHTTLHLELEWCIFHILTSDDMDDFTDIKFVSYGNIFESPSKVSGNNRKYSENVRERSSGLRSNFGKSSEIFGQWSEIFGKRRHRYVCN